jgi:hypothetical protein
MSELLAFVSLAREIRLLLIEVGKLLASGERERAADIVRNVELSKAAGKAGWLASKNAGKKKL